MKTPLARVFLCGALFLSLPAWHALAQSQHEMNAMAAEKFAAADKKLNLVYKQLSAKLEADDLAKLKTAQRAWVTFRDAEADLQGDLEAKGGSMRPLIVDGTRTQLTEDRTKALQAVLKGFGK